MTDVVERYDPARDAWDTMAPLPHPAASIAVAAVGDRIYVAGGYTADYSGVSAEVFSYDPAADSWQSEPSMPTARANPGGAAFNGKFAVVGGRTTYNASQVAGAVELFDPGTGSWSRLPTDLPTPREAVAVIVAAGDLWVIGGANNDINTSYGMTLSEVYRAGSGQWETGPELLMPRVGLAGGSVRGQLVVAGGWSPSAHTATAEVLAPGAAAWEGLPSMPTARANPAAVCIGDEFLVAGGWQYAGVGDQTQVGAVEILSWR
jgi:N-acetylneuraminic acid mutarotase